MMKNKQIIYSVVRDSIDWNNYGERALQFSAITAHSKTHEKAEELLEEYKQQMKDKGFPDDGFEWRIVGNIFYDT